MPGRFTRPVLAFSALALLAALAPAEGSADDAQPQQAAPAHAPGTEGSTDVSAAGASAERPGRRGAGTPARAPHAPELRDNPLFGYDGARRPGTPAAPDGDTDAKAPAGGAAAAGERRAVAHPGGRRAAGERVARKPVAAPGLALEAAVGRTARTRVQATADALTRHAERIQQRVAAYHAWGLEEPPPARPAPPVLKPRVRGARVVRSVPTDDRVVFLTIDDGAMKSPAFLRMVDDLDVPVTSFLADEEAVLGPGYGYFRTLESLGGTTQNHTLRHPYLPALSFKDQRREICGQQDRLQQEAGGPQPRLFRPPYGAYDRDTLRAARDCGIDAVVLWGMEAWADRVDFQEPERRLYPGAIILTHYRGPAAWGDGGTMVDMLRRVLELAAEQGYAVARLEDYL